MEDRPNERIDGMVEHNNLNTMEMRNVRVYEPVTTVTTRIFTKNVAHMNPNLDKKSKVAIKEQGEINVDEIGLNVGEDKALTRNNLKGAHSISLKVCKLAQRVLHLGGDLEREYGQPSMNQSSDEEGLWDDSHMYSFADGDG
ncbi:hypothetical protein V6N13_093229 [Hibiscus sabdariffa]|uniref:Uncharacterized protein n=1 Tax=Hibiscus sabdariffa TaxID=183260 RepID=A0ABR1ZPJ6_9ROSI